MQVALNISTNTGTSKAEKQANLAAKQEQIASMRPEDSVSLSAEAARALEIEDAQKRTKKFEADLMAAREYDKNAPKIDWETRTYMGKPIPDSYHQEMTPAMITGEQPYRHAFGAMGNFYIESEFTEAERSYQVDVDMMQAKLRNIEGFSASVEKNKAQQESLLKDGADPMSMRVQDAQYGEMRDQFYLDFYKADLQHYITTRAKGYEKYNISLDDWRDGLLKMSDNKIDLYAIYSYST